MSMKSRTIFDKLNTLFNGKDLRVTGGEVFPEVYPNDFSSYFPVMKYITEQNCPNSSVYDIRDFGGLPVSDKDNADAINSAISECSKNGGGTVIVSGGNYRTHTIKLKSDITLFIEAGSKLTAVLDSEKYENNALIFADDCDNIAITGGGKICGEGNFFGLKPILPPMTTAPEVIDVIALRCEYRKRLRFAHPSKYGRLCTLNNCRNVRIQNIIFENSASWTLNICNCSVVKVSNFMINNNRHIANSDGIDIVGSSNVEIKKCFISTGDDGICLKNAAWLGCKAAMSHIHISDCEIMSCTNSFKIGTETTFDIYDVLVENCKLLMTDIWPGSVSGISVESCDGSKVYDITVRNITMDRVTCPVFIRLCNRNRAAEVNEVTAHATELKIDSKISSLPPSQKKLFDSKGEIQNVIIENLTATDIELPIIISGYSQILKGTKYIENVMLRNLDLTYRSCQDIIDRRLFIPEYAKDYPESWRFRNLPSYALFLRHAKNVRLQNLKCTPPVGTKRQAEYLTDVE